MTNGKARKIIFSKEVWGVILLCVIVAYQLLKENFYAVYGSSAVAVIALVYGLYTMYDLALKKASALSARDDIKELPVRKVRASDEEGLKSKSLFWLWLEAIYLYVFRLVFIVISLAFAGQILGDHKPSAVIKSVPASHYLDYFVSVLVTWWSSLPWLAELSGIPIRWVRFDYRDLFGGAYIGALYATYAFAVTSCAGALVKLGMRRAELQRRLAGAIKVARN